MSAPPHDQIFKIKAPGNAGAFYFSEIFVAVDRIVAACPRYAKAEFVMIERMFYWHRIFTHLKKLPYEPDI